MNSERDLESREYDVNDIVDDKRFIRCKKEMWIVLLIGSIQIIIPTILIYTLNGNGKWFAGVPMWYGVTALFYLCISLVSIIIAKTVIKNHKLDAVADDEQV